jgi:hypothetical protein
MGPTGQKSCQFFVNSRLVFSAKNFEKCGGFLFRKCKVVIFGKFGIKSGGFMLLTPVSHLQNAPCVHCALFGLRRNPRRFRSTPPGRPAPYMLVRSAGAR